LEDSEKSQLEKEISELKAENKKLKKMVRIVNYQKRTTEEGKEFVGKYYKEGYAYDGAKVSMQINENQIDNREWLSKLISITAENLPIPKPKKFNCS
jgi:hypothetical protein